MTFAELYRAVADHVGPKVTFSIDVETWRYATELREEHEITWSIFASELGGSYTGTTAELALGRLLRRDKEWLPTDSVDAVGEVSL